MVFCFSVIVRDFIDSIPMAKMTRFKMLSIRNIVTNHLFRSPGMLYLYFKLFVDV